MLTQPIEIFISYRWTEPSIRIADRIQRILSSTPYNFKIKRDNTEVGYKGDLERYMNELANGQFVIVILSDGYLKSRHCMKELVLLKSKDDFQNRIFPIVLDDALIREMIPRNAYADFWTREHDRLNKDFARNRDFAHREEYVKEITLVSDIADACLNVTTIINNMNTLSDRVLRLRGYDTIAKAFQNEILRLQLLSQTHVDGKPSLKENLKYACDRVSQMEAFEKGFTIGEYPLRFFFLHGEEAQSHEGFVRRMKLDLEGEYYKNNKRDLTCSIHILSYPPTAEFEFDLQRLLADIHREYDLNPDDRRPLLEQRFGRLLKDSNSTSALRSKDIDLLLILMNDFDFMHNEVPKKVIRWINGEFFQRAAFEPDAPEVIVIWGIKYTIYFKNRIACTNAIKEFASTSEHCQVLPELSPVQNIDIKRWLQDYQPKRKPKEQDDIVLQKIGDQQLDMLTVEEILTKLIEDYNNYQK
jgi:hypothetical protein